MALKGNSDLSAEVRRAIRSALRLLSKSNREPTCELAEITFEREALTGNSL